MHKPEPCAPLEYFENPAMMYVNANRNGDYRSNFNRFNPNNRNFGRNFQNWRKFDNFGWRGNNFARRPNNFNSNNFNPNRNFQGSNPNLNRAIEPQKAVTCFKCGITGHYSNKCRAPKSEAIRGNSKNVMRRR